MQVATRRSSSASFNTSKAHVSVPVWNKSLRLMRKKPQPNKVLRICLGTTEERRREFSFSLVKFQQLTPKCSAGADAISINGPEGSNISTTLCFKVLFYWGKLNFFLFVATVIVIHGFGTRSVGSEKWWQARRNSGSAVLKWRPSLLQNLPTHRSDCNIFGLY
ncbi:hypothetical protein VNO80_24101 [Phaseolus coccineus]|uniref:Uncharacterized protein n=1 Tax=Phaseolus coccineus TaxID=3886 RepID=A0AAN9LSA9_PHACN